MPSFNLNSFVGSGIILEREDGSNKKVIKRMIIKRQFEKGDSIERFKVLAILLLIISYLFCAERTFAEQIITITWYYDESQTFVVSEYTKTASVGEIYIYASVSRFKMYVEPVVLDSQDVVVKSVNIGNTKISMSQDKPTKINNFIRGILSLRFDLDEAAGDFQVSLTFVFLPF
ncbi:hypothetical protein IB67_03450 [Fervidobacterium riparium]|uniref:Uncharacterized protein n=2 Tax=Fervidobacterium gondwanense TaxID=44754 RepID=A0A1M7SQG7_FERGO|nr:hypothetical protein IB67_03450 [Fervidobacterium riparium]SHN60654.1 hypothetical protein SAMN02745226_01133 [Fervidobacterium gondwanense DSM 13020]